MITVNHFSFSYGNKKILNDIGFSVDKGERVSLIGPNGAGKSTLLKCINRILVGGHGQIQIDGIDLNSLSQNELAKKVAYVAQSDHYVPPFSVGEYVLMGRYPYRRSWFSFSKQDEIKMEEALEITGMSEFKDRNLDTLSGGERQKVYVAGAVVQDAQILLLDEPTTFLDPKHANEIHRLLINIQKERGITILSVTHDINSALLSSDRILGLKDGQQVFLGKPDELTANSTLQDIFQTSFSFMAHPTSGNKLVVPMGPL